MTETPAEQLRGREEIQALVADVPEPERSELLALAERLAERPIPRPAVRAEIRRRIAEVESAPRPEQLRRRVAAYLSSGGVLLVLAALGATGAGPLG